MIFSHQLTKERGREREGKKPDLEPERRLCGEGRWSCVCACVRASVRACVVYHVGAPNLRCFGGNDGRYMVHKQRKCLTGTYYFS